MSSTPSFPGRVVRIGDHRRDVVRLVQERLDQLGAGPLAADGVFGSGTRAAVVRFQSRRGLLSDGVVGPATWKELFGLGGQTAPAPSSPSGLIAQVLRVAGAEVGTRESGGPNRGPRVDEYLRAVGLDPTRGSYAWCASFVYYCFKSASVTLSARNPCVRTAGCMAHWQRAPERARLPSSEISDPATTIRPGAIFIVDHGKGRGHTGLVERVTASSIHTIEGNTNEGGSREGDGVYRRVRPLSRINTGFIDYALLTQRSSEVTS